MVARHAGGEVVGGFAVLFQASVRSAIFARPWLDGRNVRENLAASGMIASASCQFIVVLKRQPKIVKSLICQKFPNIPLV